MQPITRKAVQQTRHLLLGTRYKARVLSLNDAVTYRAVWAQLTAYGRGAVIDVPGEPISETERQSLCDALRRDPVVIDHVYSVVDMIDYEFSVKLLLDGRQFFQYFLNIARSHHGHNMCDTTETMVQHHATALRAYLVRRGIANEMGDMPWGPMPNMYGEYQPRDGYRVFALRGKFVDVYGQGPRAQVRVRIVHDGGILYMAVVRNNNNNDGWMDRVFEVLIRALQEE